MTMSGMEIANRKALQHLHLNCRQQVKEHEKKVNDWSNLDDVISCAVYFENNLIADGKGNSYPR
jgi:hypothetical protein